ncbi:MAG: DUF2891 domain-containing protein [Phycisphaerae bacterium]|nr:DUF2891 domain-containing protein [Phycisphaerae bacterium]
MRLHIGILWVFVLICPVLAEPPSPPDAGVLRFADMALECVHREYPSKIAHVMNSDADARPPRELTPIFYGCFDWHSAVHGHWLLVRVARRWPESDAAIKARRALDESSAPEHVAAEVAYLNGEGRKSFERPYGLAWLLQLAAELHEWDEPQARRWSETLAPLERQAAQRFRDWLPKLSHPVRTGEHSQTAFALGLVFDWARITGDVEMQQLIAARARDYYLSDPAANFAFEPGGEDFLSPALAEADLMRRVLDPPAFAAWLGVFLPQISLDGSSSFLKPAVVTDRSDGKLVHLDGLNLSRAWMLQGIASGLPSGDPRISGLLKAAKEHADAGLLAIENQQYEGGHWLGSFAVYLVTERGLAVKQE